MRKETKDPLTGETFGKYLLLKRLAVGGMAEVYLARLQAAAGFNKPVVLKQVLPRLADDPSFIEMFLDEARLAARLSHPNIAQTFDLGAEDGRYYLAMEYVAGETILRVLERASQKQSPVPLPCVLRVLLQLLDALEYAHNLADERGQPLNIIHRDVSPSNVVLTYHGGVKLLDFGIARATTRSHHTSAGVIKGKFGFMAPEQCHSGSAIDRRVDIFAAGAVLYALATGRAAFEQTRDVLARYSQMREARFTPPRQVNPAVPPALERVILKAMARSPDQRYPSAASMAEDLERLAAEARLFPGPRVLRDYLQLLFPEMAPLAHAIEQSPDVKAVAQMIETIGRVDRTSLDSLGHPRARTEKPTWASRPASPPTAPPSITADREETADSDATVTASPATPPPLRSLRRAPPTRPRGSFADPGPTESPPSRPGRRRLFLIVAGLAAPVLGVSLWLLLPKKEPDPPKQAKPSVEAKVPPAAPPKAPAQASAAQRRAGELAGEEHSHPVEPRAQLPSRKTKPATPKKRKESPTVASAPRPTGFLIIDAYPWAKVKEAGRELGVTPLKVELPAGPHKLLLENEDLGFRRTVRLVVREGEETSHFERAMVRPGQR